MIIVRGGRCEINKGRKMKERHKSLKDDLQDVEGRMAEMLETVV